MYIRYDNVTGVITAGPQDTVPIGTVGETVRETPASADVGFSEWDEATRNYIDPTPTVNSWNALTDEERTNLLNLLRLVGVISGPRLAVLKTL
jgi:hypothetical protein